MSANADLQRRLDVASRAAWEAGKITLRYFQTGVAVELKADDSPVTIADKESERFLSGLLHREFPKDGFLGEESGETPGSSGYRWIVDPIDGTKSFVQGVPLYGGMVGLVDQADDPVVGAVCLPALGELVSAARGGGCYFNGRRVQVSKVKTIGEACIAATDLELFEETGTKASFDRVQSAARMTRTWGDCYGHLLVATGRAEVMLDPILAEWDSTALLPILEEAGGSFTDWKGNRTVFGKSGVSTNGHVRQELFDLLNAKA